jgi:TrpR-related protein YerC/YecD
MKPNRQDTESQQRAAEDALFGALISLRTLTECRNFFRDLCTPAELQALVDRWQVVELLEQGLTYRKINELTGVSVTTIGRHSPRKPHFSLKEIQWTAVSSA